MSVPSIEIVVICEQICKVRRDRHAFTPGFQFEDLIGHDADLLGDRGEHFSRSSCGRTFCDLRLLCRVTNPGRFFVQNIMPVVEKISVQHTSSAAASGVPPLKWSSLKYGILP